MSSENVKQRVTTAIPTLGDFPQLSRHPSIYFNDLNNPRLYSAVKLDNGVVIAAREATPTGIVGYFFVSAPFVEMPNRRAPLTEKIISSLEECGLRQSGFALDESGARIVRFTGTHEAYALWLEARRQDGSS